MPVVSVQAYRKNTTYPPGVGTQVVNGDLWIDATARIGLDANVFTSAGTYTVFTFTTLYGTVTTANFIPPAGLTVASVQVDANAIVVTLV